MNIPVIVSAQCGAIAAGIAQRRMRCEETQKAYEEALKSAKLKETKKTKKGNNK